MKYRLEIKPAISPKHRHKIETLLKQIGYEVYGGGSDVDKSVCGTSFSLPVKGIKCKPGAILNEPQAIKNFGKPGFIIQLNADWVKAHPNELSYEILYEEIK